MDPKNQSQICKTCGYSNTAHDEYCRECKTLLDVDASQPSAKQNPLSEQAPAVSGNQLPRPERPSQPDRRFLRNIPLRIRIVAVAVFLLVLVAGSIIAATTYKKLEGGGLDLSKYCASLHYEEAVETAAGWYCSGQPSLKIDMTRACSWQYPKNNLTARTNNDKNPFSWRCYDLQNHDIGGIKDMSGYCASQGYDKISYNVNSANDWYCKRQPKLNIDMTRACTQQYGRPDAQARKNDNNLWECYGLVILG
jgi:hypothetical protein